MNNSVRAHESERGEHLGREPPDEDRREAAELVGLDQLVEVDTQKLRDNAEMAPEVEVVRHLDHVVLVLWVPLDDLLQNFDLNQGLSVEALLVADNLDCDGSASLVVTAVHNLTKRSLSEDIADLVAVTQVVALHDNVVTALIVVAVVVCLSIGLRAATDVVRDVVDVVKVENLLALIIRQRVEMSRDE